MHRRAQRQNLSPRTPARHARQSAIAHAQQDSYRLVHMLYMLRTISKRPRGLDHLALSIVPHGALAAHHIGNRADGHSGLFRDVFDSSHI